MSDVFTSYARSTAKQANVVTEAVRGLCYSVWIDDDLPAHRTYGRVIEEPMTAAKAAAVMS
jgi:adenylate cyclase